MAHIGDGLSKFALSAEIQLFYLVKLLLPSVRPIFLQGPQFEVQLSSGMNMFCVALPYLQSTHSHENSVCCAAAECGFITATPQAVLTLPRTELQWVSMATQTCKESH